MLNKYPLWKNLIVITAIVLGIIYSLPNIYPPDYAVQISSQTNEEILGGHVLPAVEESLTNAGLEYFGVEHSGVSILIRFPDDVTQRIAQSNIQRALFEADGDYVVALNAAPSTPGWLKPPQVPTGL